MDFYTGMVVPWSIAWVPEGYQFCQGQELQIQQYQAVYSLIGISFGGDAVRTFKLPDLRSRVPVGVSAGAQPSCTMGQFMGLPVNSITINMTNLPLHSHSSSFTPTTGSQAITIPAVAPSGSLSASAAVSVLAGIPTASVQSPVAGNGYYLTGAKAQAPSALSGLYTTVAPGAGTTSSLQGVSVGVTTPAGYTPGSPASTATISTVTGGSVNITPGGGNPAGAQPLSINNLQPSLGLNFLFCIQGIYPQRAN
jgi:microcystin-dependent protein